MKENGQSPTAHPRSLANNPSPAIYLSLLSAERRARPTYRIPRSAPTGQDFFRVLWEGSEGREVLSHSTRREALFQKSVADEKGRGDALSKRFEEALKQAHQEPITKPTRDFDLD